MKVRNVAAGLVVVGLLLACSRTGTEVADTPTPSGTATGTSAAPTTAPPTTAPPAGPCDALANLEVSNYSHTFEPEWPEPVVMTLSDGVYDQGSRHIELLDICAFGDISGDGVADAAGVINFATLGYFLAVWNGTGSGYDLSGHVILYDAPAVSVTIAGGHGTVVMGDFIPAFGNTVEITISGPSDNLVCDPGAYCA